MATPFIDYLFISEISSIHQSSINISKVINTIAKFLYDFGIGTFWSCTVLNIKTRGILLQTINQIPCARLTKNFAGPRWEKYRHLLCQVWGDLPQTLRVFRLSTTNIIVARHILRTKKFHEKHVYPDKDSKNTTLTNKFLSMIRKCFSKSFLDLTVYIMNFCSFDSNVQPQNS